MADSSNDRIEYALTTVDNPFDPFTQFREWYTFDLSKGYNTPGLLARLVASSYELSDADQALIVQQAIDEIVRENALGLYRKVPRPSQSQPVT